MGCLVFHIVHAIFSPITHLVYDLYMQYLPWEKWTLIIWVDYHVLVQCVERFFFSSSIIWICPIVKPLFPGTPHPLTLNSKRFGHHSSSFLSNDWMVKFFKTNFQVSLSLQLAKLPKNQGRYSAISWLKLHGNHVAQNFSQL